MEASYNIGTDYWTELRITGTTGNKNQTETQKNGILIGTYWNLEIQLSYFHTERKMTETGIKFWKMITNMGSHR